jgi:hypothetical protein
VLFPLSLSGRIKEEEGERERGRGRRKWDRGHFFLVGEGIK